VSANPVAIEEAVSSGLPSLVQANGGLFGPVLTIRPGGVEPKLITQIVSSGDIRQLTARSGAAGDLPRHPLTIDGTGTAFQVEEAIIPALAEGLERYSACICEKEQYILAPADDMGANVLDLDTIARCSRTELSHPRCPLVAPDKKAPIRWVAGLSLLDGRVVYLPAVLVYQHMGVTSAAERIVLPISTGCAAHTTYEEALLRALLEVVERDAISIVWLQKLRLPRVDVDSVPAALEPYWSSYRRSSKHLEYAFFDATTDLGIPTIYGLQMAPEDRRVTTLVSCSTSMEAPAALAKVMRDMSALRIAFRRPQRIPETCDEFKSILDGATYMARAEQAPAFDFLLNSGRTRRLSEMSVPGGRGTTGQRVVLDLLRHRGLEAYAVDLSSDEALRCGVRVVRAVIPGLQPLSFCHRARYLGHPRLYDAPLRMGYRSYPEEQLNSWPQPFA
jgi:ribosomal protein S12 methylthiotransferase accessory factor